MFILTGSGIVYPAIRMSQSTARNDSQGSSQHDASNSCGSCRIYLRGLRQSLSFFEKVVICRRLQLLVFFESPRIPVSPLDYSCHFVCVGRLRCHMYVERIRCNTNSSTSTRGPLLNSCVDSFFESGFRFRSSESEIRSGDGGESSGTSVWTATLARDGKITL